MIRRPYLMLPLAVLLVAMISVAAWSDTAVQVFVENKSVDLNMVSMTGFMSDDIYVPIRPFAEMLGATVEWDRSSGTLVVSSPTGSGSMRLGSNVAEIGTTQVGFRYPPYMHQDRFHGPILFFNEMFDQAWHWDPLRKEFRWIPIFPRWGGGPSNPPTIIYGPGRTTRVEEVAPIPSTRAVVGEVVRVLPSDTNPMIVVQADGRNVTYPIARDAIILRGLVGGQGMEVPVGNLLSGDRVILRFAEDDRVSSIRAHYRLTVGRVSSITGGNILLTSGEILRSTERTEVLLPDNTRGDIQHIVPGDEVAASVSPSSGRAYTIRLLPGVGDIDPATGARVASKDHPITLSTHGPLGTGDALVVQFKAEAGGQAWFTIPGARANVPMAEVEPGQYRGDYVVRQGDMALRQPVKVHFLAPGGESYSSLSRLPITIQTVAGYLPRVTSPRQGEEIDSPVVVQGMAEPGTRVRVTIEYRRDVLRLMPIRGVTAVDEVRADSEGRWQTPPLSATASFVERYEDIPSNFGIFTDLFRSPEEPPVIFTITATSLGPAGEELASYRVEVTRQPGRRLGG